MVEMYRQGDVLFMKITKDEMPKKTRPKKNNVVVEGEATGHAHRLQNGELLINEMSRMWGGGAELFITAGAQTQITHEEHNTIDLPEGFYKVVRQKEYAPNSKSRFVED